MMRIFTFCTLFVWVSFASAQITSSDYRDASGGGPFPIYLGLAKMNTWKHADFMQLRNTFANAENTVIQRKRRLSGVEALVGVSYIPEGRNWPFALVLEMRGYHMARKLKILDQSISMAIQQASLSAGIRYAIFPAMIQIQGGPIMFYREEFRSTIDQQQTRIFSPSNFEFKGWTTLFRFSLLDPAGSGGGVGAFVEWGYNWPRVSGDQLNEIIDSIDAASPDISRKRRYGYFSFGFLAPIAIKIR